MGCLFRCMRTLMGRAQSDWFGLTFYGNQRVNKTAYAGRHKRLQVPRAVLVVAAPSLSPGFASDVLYHPPEVLWAVAAVASMSSS